jgi:hypothetical protein
MDEVLRTVGRDRGVVSRLRSGKNTCGLQVRGKLIRPFQPLPDRDGLRLILETALDAVVVMKPTASWLIGTITPWTSFGGRMARLSGGQSPTS